MKYILILCLLFVSCKSKTEYGECVGLNGQEKPNLEYEYNVRNIILGIVFIEAIAPPIIILLKEYKCPIGDKSK